MVIHETCATLESATLNHEKADEQLGEFCTAFLDEEREFKDSGGKYSKFVQVFVGV